VLEDEDLQPLASRQVLETARTLKNVPTEQVLPTLIQSK
jgi:hypothetical protein